MGANGGAKFAGLALIIGAPLYVAAEMIKRRGDMASSGTDAMLANAALSHVMAELSILGLLATLFGLYTLWRVAQRGSWGEGLVRFGLLSMTVGFVGFILSNGLDHVTLHVLQHEEATDQSTLDAMARTISSTRAGVVVASGSVVLFGGLLLAIGLRLTLLSTFQRVTARVMEFVCTIGLATHVLAEHFHTSLLYSITGMVTFLLAIWFIILGVGILRRVIQVVDASQLAGNASD